ncbi:hypothetical protein B0F90DRAFT_96719 [Multifurca ochricompacta]|uniref:Uncharacterized protein n=1 Tax=Multifurca ochricompacta TaxID=376703 RepID=A0AAD4MDC0_9AGAM|nr:hypothetical protein B0F90DRAFT_96719 [Multifurca ochricompacta]
MSQPVITVTYNLVVPEGTQPPSPESSISHSRQITPDTRGFKEYYNALQVAIDEIKAATGHELTAWRDAVGDKELGKEGYVKKDEGEGSDEEEGEEMSQSLHFGASNSDPSFDFYSMRF